MKKHYLILLIGAMIIITGCKKSKLNKELVNSSYTLHNLNKPYSESYWNGSTEGDLKVI